jgi:glycosyltransferase involved in cell wall biosynthesis
VPCLTFSFPKKKINVPIITTIHTTIEGQVNAINKIKKEYNNCQLERSEKMVLSLSPILKLMEDYYYRKSHYYITVSNWAKRQFMEEKNISGDNIRVIHNGVDINRFNPKYRASSDSLNSANLNSTNSECIKILYLSRLIGYKGINCLIDAIPKIKERANAQFMFAGAGNNSALKLNKENCTFLGYVPDEVKNKLYSAADIFILPSLYENFPISILEAMASGCAVIATDVGGIPEVIENNKNGLLIPPNDSSSLAEAIMYLIENKDFRLKLAKNARKTIEEHFDAKAMALKTKNFYNYVLANDGRIV